VVNKRYADVEKPNIEYIKPVLNDIEHSDLLDQLAHVYHHDSVLEHCNLTYLVKGISRGVLQEHVRHRIQSLTVQSTRYTMSSILNAYMSFNNLAFVDYILSLNMFVVTGLAAKIEAQQLWEKLSAQEEELGEQKFVELSIAKSSIPLIANKLGYSLFRSLQAGKQKRNVGDNFKWIVTDNWKVDLVFTMNLRGLKNYLKLRDSGAAYFQAQWLAQAVIEATPQKYLNLLNKKYQKD